MMDFPRPYDWYLEKSQLKKKVQKAVNSAKQGEFYLFVKQIADVADVRYRYHRTFVDGEIAKTIYVDNPDLVAEMFFIKYKDIVSESYKRKFLSKLRQLKVAKAL